LKDRLKVLHVSALSLIFDDRKPGWALDETPLGASERFTDGLDVACMAMLHVFPTWEALTEAHKQAMAAQPRSVFYDIATESTVEAALATAERARGDGGGEEGGQEAESPAHRVTRGAAAGAAAAGGGGGGGLGGGGNMRVRPRVDRTPPRNTPDQRVQVSALLCRVAWQMACLFNQPKAPGGGAWRFPMKLPVGVMSEEDWRSMYTFARSDPYGKALVDEKKRAELKAAIRASPDGYVPPKMQESHVAPLVEAWALQTKNVNGDYGAAFLQGVVDRLIAAGEATAATARDTPAGQRQRMERQEAGGGADPSRPNRTLHYGE